MIREEIEKKIQELSRKSEVKTILMIEWLQGLLAKLPEEPKKVEVVQKKVEVELPVEEDAKPAPKRKIVFKKK